MTILPDYAQADKLFQVFKIDVPHETFCQFETYAEFLVEYNQYVNLTAVTDGDSILKKHFLDSILLHEYAKSCFPQSAKILDIGSGAGFPGVPLSLIRPDLQVVLLDSLRKRIVFLEKLREKLHCSYTAVHGRAEELAKDPMYRESFDVVTARAVASLPILAELSLPYVKTGGYWLAMKSHETIEPALQAIQMLGGEWVDTVSYQLPGGDVRNLHLIRKISPCTTKYPRKFAQIKQKSL